MAVASAFESLFCADALTLSSTAAWLSCCSSLINPPVSLSIKGASATVNCHSNYRRNRVKHKLRQANPARSDVDGAVVVQPTTWRTLISLEQNELTVTQAAHVRMSLRNHSLEELAAHVSVQRV